MTELTHDQIVLAVIGLLAVVGGVVIVLSQIFKRFGLGQCPDVCPEPDCKNMVAQTKDLTDSIKSDAVEARKAASEARNSIIILQEGQNNVRQILEQKRIKIEGLQQDSAEIKTDVKWIVRAIQAKNKI